MQLPKKLQPVTEKEILKEIADELKLNIKDVERTYDIWLDFVDYIANETDQAAISFPPLGKLYVSTQKIRTGMVTEKLKKFRENKMREIIKARENSIYNIHEHNVPIILKYGISKKNSIPYILNQSDKTDFYTINELVNKQKDVFFNEDFEFSEQKKLKPKFIRKKEKDV